MPRSTDASCRALGLGDTVQTTMKLSIVALSLATGIVACASDRTKDSAIQDDFKRDLQLASSTTMDLAAPKVDPALLTSLETRPQGAPEPAPTLKKGAGNRAVRTQTPTVFATPEHDVAETEEESEQVETLEIAPVPEPTHEPVAVAPRPTPVILPTGGAGDYGTSGNGGGVLGGGGGVYGGGVVIRGGGVDGDRCEIHARGGRRGPVYGTPYPVPTSTGGIRIGSRGGSRTMPRTTSRSSGLGTSVRTTSVRMTSARVRGR